MQKRKTKPNKFAVVPYLLYAIILVGLSLNACQSKIDPYESLKKKIEKTIDENEGNFALVFYDLQDSTHSILFNEKRTFHAASTMKTAVLFELFKQVDEGLLQLHDSMLVENAFLSIYDSSLYSLDLEEDSGEQLYQMIGKKASLYDLAFAMITQSSNLATNMLIKKLDAKKINQSLREIGITDMNVLRGVEDLKAYEAGMSNTTTARSLALLFEKLGRMELIDSSASTTMIDILSQQAFNEIIPDLLPEDVVVAHKTGQINQVMHDSGLVILPDGRKYVLVLLSDDWSSEKTTRMTLSKLSGLVYQYMK